MPQQRIYADIAMKGVDLVIDRRQNRRYAFWRFGDDTDGSEGTGMSGIAIFGAGVSGLHLGLLLRAHDVPVTIYADKDPDAVRTSRLPNTVGHHHHTLERERILGVHHWDASRYGYTCHHHCVKAETDVRFRGDFDRPSSVIDYRLYLPRLMEDFVERGGELVIQSITLDGVERLSGNYDLVVIAVGRGGIGEKLFARRADKSPYDAPQRRLSAGIYAGIAYSEPKGVNLNISPGHGELVELPIFSYDGFATALLFENRPGGGLEALVDTGYEADPAAYNALVLRTLRDHYPMVHERVDQSEFGLWSERDILQGALTPVVREDYALLDSGVYAIAVGDAHTVVDPLVGQGANSASYSAWTIGEAIIADQVYDERFCHRVARNREEFVHSVSDWTNLMLAQPPHVLEFIGALAQDKRLCDEFTTNFNHPDRQVEVLATPERMHSYLARRSGVVA
jgi:Styrene monooxygenase A putative substrate binding domain